MKNLITILTIVSILFLSLNNQINAQDMKEQIPKISNFPVGD